MNEHEEIAKALMSRLSELRTHLAKVGHELHKPLPADSEEQAIELEYGTCAKCRGPIEPGRLKALPTAVTCVSCSA